MTSADVMSSLHGPQAGHAGLSRPAPRKQAGPRSDAATPGARAVARYDTRPEKGREGCDLRPKGAVHSSSTGLPAGLWPVEAPPAGPAQLPHSEAMGGGSHTNAVRLTSGMTPRAALRGPGSARAEKTKPLRGSGEPAGLGFLSPGLPQPRAGTPGEIPRTA